MLSTSMQTEVNLPYITAVDSVPKFLLETITRAKFESLIKDLIDRTIGPCEKALKDSGFSVNEIDEVILVGGSTRIPIVQETVKNLFNKEPHKGVNPDEVVAIGAAIQGGVLAGDVSDVLLLDVTPLSLGIETLGGVNTKLIDANTTIPVKKSQIFSTASDSQPSVEIHVLQGERPLAIDNRTLGRFHLDGIPPAPRGVPQIEVTFDIDANGILQVTAKDLGTGKSQDIRITHSSGLTEQEIEKMKNDAKMHEAEDKKKREEIDVKNQADAMVFQGEKQLKEFETKLSPDLRSKIQSALDRLKEASKGTNITEIKNAMDSYNQAWNEASTQMYSQTRQQQTSGQQPGGEQTQQSTSGEQKPGDDGKVENADFEVMDDKK